MPPNRTLLRCLWIVVIFLAAIGVAVGTRRTIVLLSPRQNVAAKNPAASLDAHFADHRALTLTHILPGMLFMVLGPLQFMKRLRARYPRFHRWNGRIFLLASLVLGVAGLAMAAGDTVGGRDEKAAIFVFGSFFLFALAKAFQHGLQRNFASHRAWMIRGYAVGLAVAAIRPIMGTFFAAAALRGRTPQPQHFFGTAFWIGFSLTALTAEIWIRYTQNRPRGLQPCG
jgi:Predicted membrane protein (DUF2306).